MENWTGVRIHTNQARGKFLEQFNWAAIPGPPGFVVPPVTPLPSISSEGDEDRSQDSFGSDLSDSEVTATTDGEDPFFDPNERRHFSDFFALPRALQPSVRPASPSTPSRASRITGPRVITPDAPPQGKRKRREGCDTAELVGGDCTSKKLKIDSTGGSHVVSCAVC